MSPRMSNEDVAKIEGKRVVRGREKESRQHYRSASPSTANA